jgi:hypothetical protein
MEILEVMRAGRATENSDCILCERVISVGSPQIYVEVKVGASFMKALQKTIRKCACIPCAKSILGCLTARVEEAERL